MSFKVQLLRHATLLLDINGKRILVDPMLSKKEAMEPVPNASNSDRIPLVDLPISDSGLEALLHNTNAVLVTHTHRDHWDITAQQKIPSDTTILCQPADEALIKEQGFTKVKKVEPELHWEDIVIHRTGGQHGTGEIGKLMGTVSGFVLVQGKHRLYIAGDTIWCKEVEDAITIHQPTHIIVNGGGAQFVQGGPITMTTDDVLQVARFSKAPVTVVHLETVNHCHQKRPDFKKAIADNKLSGRIAVPDDGGWWELQ
jgi:L-ascorbate metabolism protein UlaG (beta-lactamase superfamily)